MSEPALDPVARDVYDRLRPLAFADEATGWTLLWLVAALCAPAEEISDLIRDRDNMPGWAVLLNVDLTPDSALDWLGQLVGARIPPDMTPDQKRGYIKSQAGQKRGSVGAMKSALRAWLDPESTQTIYFSERVGGSVWRVRVATRDDETLDPVKAERDLRSQKPVGYVLEYSTVTGADYDTLRDTHADYNEVLADFTDYDEVRDDPGHT